LSHCDDRFTLQVSACCLLDGGDKKSSLGFAMIADLLLLVLIALPQVQGLASCLALLALFGVLIQSAVYLIRRSGSFYVIFEPIFVVYLSIGVPLEFVFVSPILLGLISYFIVNPDLQWPTVSSILIAALALALIILRRVQFRSKLRTAGILKQRLLELREGKASARKKHSPLALLLLAATLLVYLALPSFQFLSQYFVISACCYVYIFAAPANTDIIRKAIFFLIFIIPVIALFNQLSIEAAFAANRTALIFPLSIGMIAFLVKQSFGDTSTKQLSHFSPSFLSKAILALVLLILALYFASSKFWDAYASPLTAFYYVYFDPTNGLGRIDRILEFYHLNPSNLGLPPFVNLWQLITVFYPRQLFPDKLDYDISVLLWERRIFPQPLFYEPFLNAILDLGRWGIAFLSIVLLTVSNVFSGIIRHSGTTVFAICLSFYIVMIVAALGFYQTVSALQASLVFIALLIPLLYGEKLARVFFRKSSKISA